jgi:APA family basic amino acid/polyamine antiporter
VDFIWFGLAAASLFIFRRRSRPSESIDDLRAQTSVREASGRSMVDSKEVYFRVPGHPVTTILFVVACALIVASTVYKYPFNSGIGLMIVAAGVPVYFFWRWRRP